MPYDRVLELMTFPDRPNLCLLGVYAQRVTLYSQQVRAINLVDAIHYYRRPLKNQEIAIVGAGAAGLTAAARALSHGASVTLFDKSPGLVGIQANSTHRWLHPKIYEWPMIEVEPSEAWAGLPVMDWRSGNANEVAEHLQKEWGRVKSTYGGRWLEKLTCKVIEVSADASGDVEISWMDLHSQQSKTFTAVILAVGFGLESTTGAQNSYWEKDSLDQTGIRNDPVLIAGYGDGGLTDLIRACIKEFDHEDLLKSVLAAVKNEDLEQIRSIELHAQARLDDFLSKQYSRLELQDVQKVLEPKINRSRQIFLTGPGKDLFIARANALNRLVVSQLLRLKAFTHIPLSSGERLGNADESGAVFLRVQKVAKTTIKRVVLRFGAKPAIESIAGLPSSLSELKQRWDDLPPNEDVTRRPIWTAFKPISPELEKCCLVLDPKQTPGALSEVFDNAIERLKTRTALERCSVDVLNCLQSQEAFLHTVRALCRAPVMIVPIGTEIDRSHAASMLLLGIRSVVRRGITLVVHERPNGIPDLPFNLKDLPILRLAEEPESAAELANTILSALTILDGDATGYRDLPVFDVVRRPSRRTPTLPSHKTEIFALCPFGGSYGEKGWGRLRLLIEGVPDLAGGKLNLRRVLDYSSPLLVGETLYELIRFAGLCLVDWSDWRPNVFFELGVRLAVNPVLPINVIDEIDPSRLSKVESQLVSLLNPLPYRSNSDPLPTEFKTEADRFKQKFRAELESRKDGLSGRDGVYSVAKRNIDPRYEFGGYPAHQELLRQVDSALGGDLVRSGRLPLLYDSSSIKSQAWRAMVETLVATRLLLQHRTALAHDDEERQHLKKALEQVDSKLGALADLHLDRDYKIGVELEDD